MKKILKFVFIFLFCTMSTCTVAATPTWTVTEDGTLVICCKAQGDILSLDFHSIGQYNKVTVSGGPLSVLDVCTLQSETNRCISIDLTNAQFPFNRIMAYNFMDFKYLEEFKCPETVTLIETEAFRNCPNLRKIVLPRTLRKVEYYAFLNCPNLEVEIPANVEIGEESFTESKVTIIDPIPEREPEVPLCRFCSWVWDWMKFGSGVAEKKDA